MRSFPLNPGSAARVGVGLVYASVLAWTVSAALCQTPVLKTRTKEEREELYARSHRITINVQVSDSSGNPVADLDAADFSLYDNQQARKIAAFHPIDGAALYDATRVVILLDAVNSPAQALEVERDGIFRYLARSHRPFSYPTSFALWFNGHLQATAATTDRNAVGRAFVKMTKGLHSNACTGDGSTAEQQAGINGGGKSGRATCRAVHFRDSIAALQGIAQQQQVSGGRTLLIWVGTGWPVLTNAEFQQLSAEEQRVYEQEYVNLTHDLGRGQVTVYSINPAEADLPAGKVKADPAASTSSPGLSQSAIARHLALHELSQRTGGRVMAESRDIAADIGVCVRDAEWYYVLSFNAPPAQHGPGELHSLSIKVNRPGLLVRTISGYYTEP